MPGRVGGRARKRALTWFRNTEGCFVLNDQFPGNFPAPLASPHRCRPGPGQLILDQTDGQFYITAGRFIFPAQTTPAWGDQDWYALQNDGDEYDVLDQKKLILKFRGMWTDAGQTECWLGWNLDTSPDTVANAEHTFYRSGGPASGIRCTSGASDAALTLRDLWPGGGNFFQVAVVLRPYTAGGLHWYPDAPGVFAHGAHFFVRDESGEGRWLRAWHRELQSRTDPLYPAFSNYDAEGDLEYVVIRCDDEDIWNPLFTPTAKDEITGANGTPLDGRVLTYAPGMLWIEDGGVWTIQGGQAVSTAVADSILYVQSGLADCWPEVPVVIGADGVGGGFVLRKSIDTGGNRNEWRFYIQTGIAGNDTFLEEVDNGVVTVKAQADNDWVQGTFDLRVRLDGQQITCYVNEVEVLHLVGAGFNETATWHGLYCHDTAQITFGSTREFIILPRGPTAAIDAALDSF